MGSGDAAQGFGKLNIYSSLSPSKKGFDEHNSRQPAPVSTFLVYLYSWVW